ncbi:MAG: hypothetical protein ACREX8_01340 [Gammaproteobacteria bacterium]
MTDDVGVPEVIQNLSQIHVDGLTAELLDIGRRAAAFDRLMASARGFRHDIGRIHADLDAEAWFAAVEIAITPRPHRPSPAAPPS